MKARPMPPPKSEAVTIAIIDDDASVRSATGRLLRSLGYVANTFERAEEFLASDEIGLTACIISDIRMPGMDGLAMQSFLTRAGRKLPVIFITAFPDKGVEARAFAAGAFGYLVKPYEEEKLIACIKTALQSA
jgi:FixJ family two-component response regulator